MSSVGNHIDFRSIPRVQYQVLTFISYFKSYVHLVLVVVSGQIEIITHLDSYQLLEN